MIKRLIGNTEPVFCDFNGDMSQPFDRYTYMQELHNLVQRDGVFGDPIIFLDLDQLCRQAYKQGYVLDYVDAYYAWSEYSMSQSASWLIGANLGSCKFLLIEKDIPNGRSISFEDLAKETEQLRQEFISKNL